MANIVKSAGFDRSQIEEIKSRISIEDIVSRYVRLKPSGKNLFGLCPFHKEDTPSFSVNPELDIYKCFGCGEGGDIFSFLQKIENVEFNEALEQLAEEAGIQLKIQKQSPEQTQKFLRIKEVQKLSTGFYHKILKEHKLGDKGQKYLKDRKISDKAIEQFQIGYSPSSRTRKLLVNTLTKKGYTEQELIDYGLAIRRDKNVLDKFTDRIVFPIFDKRGNPVAFSGRVLDSNSKRPKYLNSPETLIFQKRRNLFGFHQAKQAIRKQGYTILVEGQTDVISSWQVGVKNIVAPLGTGLTDDQLEMLKKVSPEIILAFDTDKAGIIAIMRAATIALKKGMTVYAAKIKYGKDADECIKKDPNLWNETIEERVPVITFFLDLIIEKYDPRNLDGKKALITKIAPLMKIITDQVTKEHHIKEISELTNVGIDILRETFSSETKQVKADDIIPEEVLKTDINSEMYLLSLIIQYSNQFSSKIAKLDPMIFRDEKIRKVADSIVKSLNNKSKLDLKKLISKDNTGILEDAAMRVLWSDEPTISVLTDDYEALVAKLDISALKSEISALKNDLTLSEKTGKTKKSNEILNKINALIERLDKLTRPEDST